jgi:hypothetical protein
MCFSILAAAVEEEPHRSLDPQLAFLGMRRGRSANQALGNADNKNEELLRDLAPLKRTPCNTDKLERTKRKFGVSRRQ